MKKEDLNKQFDYTLSCINDDNETLYEAKEKLQYFAYSFNSEFNNQYNRRRFPILQERIAEYLKGLPSCCSLAFADYAIIQIGKSWGFCKTEREENQFCKNWWNTVASRIIQLSNKYNIEL